MEKIFINKEREELIIEKIKDILIKKHPIVEDRLAITSKYPSPQFDIDILFINDKNTDYTIIRFLDGSEAARTSIDNEIIINGLINPSTINELIYNILLDHDYISHSSLTSSEMNISFKYDLRENNLKGISCGVITLNLYFKSHPEEEQLQDLYSKEIIKLYEPELSRAFSLNNELTDKIKTLKYIK